MVGFGVLGSGFAAAMIYGTPSFGGLQLNVGTFDPAAVVGPGWIGTKWVRPEAELTFDQDLRSRPESSSSSPMGPIQKVYKPGSVFPAPTTSARRPSLGAGYGGRFELGPARLGVAGHYGKGLGLSYALENSYAAADADTRLRWS